MRILLIEDHAIFREALRELLHAKDPSFEVVAEAATAFHQKLSLLILGGRFHQ